jgi:hypothetical protein
MMLNKKIKDYFPEIFAIGWIIFITIIAFYITK